MANILDYVMWRGDLPLETIPFCDIDFLVLSRLAYVPFDGAVSDSFDEKTLTLEEAAKRVFTLAEMAGEEHQFRMSDDEALLRLAAGSGRFRSLYISGFVNVFDAKQQEQFSAVTFFLPDKSAAVAFRGTDGTLVGWKEDFDMAWSDVVPAQTDAVFYLKRLAESFDGRIQLGGHSKGGNLAVYSAAMCGTSIQARISEIRNFDGPGFQDAAVRMAEFQNVMARVKTFLPQSSIIGMLLEHTEDFSIVGSRSVSIFQHNVYMWDVMGGDFITVESRTNSSHFIDATLKEWVASMDPELREKMINGIYDALASADVKTLRDLWNGKNTVIVFRAMSNMDDETRNVMKLGFKKLREAMKSSMPELLERMRTKSTHKQSPFLTKKKRAVRTENTKLLM